LKQSLEQKTLRSRIVRLHLIIKEAHLLDRESGQEFVESLYKSAPIRNLVKRVYDRIHNKNIPKFQRQYREFEEKILIPELQRAIRKELIRKHGKQEFAKDPAGEATKATARIFGTMDLERVQTEGATLLKSGYTAAFVDGGDASYRLAGVQANFDVLRPEAVEAINRFGSDLIVQVTDQTRKAVRDVVRFGIENGYSMPKIARDLTMIQTLFPKWAMAVTNYNFKLWQQGVPADRIQKLVKRYRDRLLRARRLMIARTETAIAQAQGSLQGYKSIGVTRVRFYAAHGACPICAAMDGTVYRIDEAYGVIPVHPNGRCDWISVMPRGGYKDPRRYVPAKGLKAGINRAIADIMALFARRPVEHCAALDDAGNVLFTKSGSRSSISFFPSELDLMRNAGALIHNHPACSSFSWNDIGLAADLNLGQLLVCSEKYRYTLTPAPGRTWNSFAAPSLRKEYDRLTPKFQRMYDDLVREARETAEITPQLENEIAHEIHLQHTHEAMESVARKYGYTYKREPVSGGE
jgi:SPP1 gp7 family putative phage head morphogenesis protein